MKKGEASRTAEAAAAVRAIHRLHDDPVVFDDAFAHELTSSAWRTIATNRILSWLVARLLLRSQRSVAAQVVGRSRFAEDLLKQAIAAGVGQYVLVGAGFDSFALRYRDSYPNLRIFELDHPDTQRVKLERIAAIGKLPHQFLEYVAVDFEQKTVAEALMGSGYEPAQPAFFSWLGTTPYLSNEATLATLSSIAGYAEPGSVVVFDYLVPDEVLCDADRQVVQELRKFTEQRGEPLVGAFHPQELQATLASIGLELVDNFSGEDQAERYFSDRKDNLRPIQASYFAHARVKESHE
jgi:methyltransferase (TIGR00027 family)